MQQLANYTYPNKLTITRDWIWKTCTVHTSNFEYLEIHENYSE